MEIILMDGSAGATDEGCYIQHIQQEDLPYMPRSGETLVAEMGSFTVKDVSYCIPEKRINIWIDAEQSDFNELYYQQD